MRVRPSGFVDVYTGALEMGQGIRTSLAQICADELGVAQARVRVVTGDTGHIAYGLGGFASRQAITAGGPNPVPPHQILAVMAVIDAGRLSAQTGRRTELALSPEERKHWA